MYKKDSQIDDFFGVKPEEKQSQTSRKDSIKETLIKKAKSQGKLRLIPKVLSARERYLILALALIIVGSIISLPFTTFYHFTKATPDYGGSFSEGLIGQPSHINPLLAQGNDIDRDITNLVYSSLMKYNDDGKLVPDLAKSYEISSDGLNYTVYLKENAKWQDGQPITAGDVVWTINAIQNLDYSSLLRVNWQGVEMEKINDYTIIFKLKNKYAQFLNNFTVSIMPEHIWQDVKPINFSLSEFNLKPIGSGPYKFKKYKKDTFGQIISYDLESNKDFYDGRPYIDKITLKFYNSEDQMIDGYNRNDIKNLSFVSPNNIKKLKFRGRLNINNLKIPRYFAVFFNQSQSNNLSDKNIRLALNYATDKQVIIKQVINEDGASANSPIIDDIVGINTPSKQYNYDPDMALKLLAAAGWTDKDSDGFFIKKSAVTTTAKNGKKTETIKTAKETRLSVKLTTSTWPELDQVAQVIKDQWAKIGVEVTLEVLPAPQLQQVIKDRKYQMLLFGEILNIDPDPFSLWHSSQKKDPGLNLALYDNSSADKLLESARQNLNPLERAKNYDDFQNLVIEDAPAIFLYNPFYIYPLSKNIKGFNAKIISIPSDRFSNIEKWHINTKRIFR